MYAPTSSYPRRSRPRSRSQSDPGHSYVIRPYTIQRPAPARQWIDPTRMAAGSTPYQHPPFRSLSAERNENPFIPHPGSLPAHHQVSNSPGTTRSPTPFPLRPPSPQRSGHQPSSSRQESILPPQDPVPLINDILQSPRVSPNGPSRVTPAEWGHGQGQGVPVHSQSLPAPTLPQDAGLQRQGSHHSVHQQPPARAYQGSLRRFGYYKPTTSHHIVHPRSRPGPPNAASHRFASSITQPVYGHGSSETLHPSRVSLDGGIPSQRSHHATSSPPPDVSTAYHPGTGPTHMGSGSPHRSRSHPRAPLANSHETTMTAQSMHMMKETLPNLPPPMLAREINRTPFRPALPANYDGRTQTRYVSMLLALDGISPLFNVLASFFTWILLAGFLLFPGTFASWQNAPAGTAASDILDVVNHTSLYVIAWLCTGVGACGMIWLWWRWQRNYVWISNRIFIPGFLNSLAGVVSTLVGVFATQGGTFGRTEKSTLIVTGALSAICGILTLMYEFWFIRNLRLEHDRIVGVEMAGKYGEGVLGEKLRNQGELTV